MHHPRINAAVEAVRACLKELRVAPYREARSGGGGRGGGTSSSGGELRYLQLTAVGTQEGQPAAQEDPLASVQVRRRSRH